MGDAEPLITDPPGAPLGDFKVRYVRYRITENDAGSPVLWARFGSVGWAELGEFVTGGTAVTLQRAPDWVPVPLPDDEGAIIDAAGPVLAARDEQ